MNRSKDELKFMYEALKWRQEALPEIRDKVYRVKNELDNFGHTGMGTRIKQLTENKATGIKKGILDELVMVYPTYWIEYKVGKNTLTREQEQFIVLAQSMGHCCFVVYTLEQYKKVMYAIRDNRNG